MALTPYRPSPFFESKNEAFWRLQFLGWSGAFLLRAVPAVVNGQDWPIFLIVLAEAVTGFSISLILATIYRELIMRKPLVTWTLAALTLLIAVLVLAFINTWVITLVRGDSELSFTAQLFGYFVYPLTLLGAWSALYFAINYFLQVESQAARLERVEAQATSAQLAMLRYQLNPHFLFNTLNSISTLVLLKQTEPANAMLTRLSSFLRHTLVTQPGGKVTLAQEVETLKLYLGIEKMRFEERLRTSFRIQDEAGKGCLPAMLLQPLVENAIKYAVSPQEEGAEITIESQKIGDRLRVSVADSGPGAQAEDAGPGLPPEITGDRRTSTGVGLANIRDRLAQAYGDNHLFEIRTPPGGGFTVVIEIPFERADDVAAEAETAGRSGQLRPVTAEPAPLIPPAFARHPIRTRP
ncbi:histidine kinase [Qipengyuania sp. JC766]|uniref:sensor histidine kinase n=1 Tax=Qipengyuania sp. JC766 TaxID=3232139 RepID=UPI0034578E9A